MRCVIPQFLDTGSGKLFACEYRAHEHTQHGTWILHLPAFAEEMNKSRAMVSAAARALAAQGAVVLVADLYGTGDSEGDFADANWQRWHADVSFLVHWMQQRGAREICLWGLRSGCLLALDWLRHNPGAIRELLLWHPVHSGQQAITQFLRLRMAAGLLNGKGETAAELRALSAQGETLEVAGYQLSPDMIRQLDAVALADLPAPAGVKVSLVEIASSADRPLSVPSRKLEELWNPEPALWETRVIRGEQFWATQEIAMAPDLVHFTVACMERDTDADSPAVPQPAGIGDGTDQQEQALAFNCRGEELVGIHHAGKEQADGAVLLLVGGPQYRVGSHRQFVLLARQLAAAGIPVLRFDYRGMGDSSGDMVDFEDAAPDIRSALDTLQQLEPQAKRLYLWGLCDAASAATFYAAGDPRVAGLVLLNPWVRSESGEARAYLKHYYLQRLLSREFWAGVVGGRFQLMNSLRDLLNKLKKSSSAGAPAGPAAGNKDTASRTPLAQRFYSGLHDFQGPVQFIFSGNDLTASEFKDAVGASRKFGKLLKASRVQINELPEADHTFSRREWKHQVENWTADWITGNQGGGK